MKNIFRIAANRISVWTGSATVFLGAIFVVILWASTGPLFNYSDTWQLVINTGTTIITFLMVFLIQNTQNRDGKALQLKLDELIRATKSARNSYVGLEDLTDDEIHQLDKEFKMISQNPNTVRALNKLREKIAQENEHRFGIKKVATSMLRNTVTVSATPATPSNTSSEPAVAKHDKQ